MLKKPEVNGNARDRKRRAEQRDRRDLHVLEQAAHLPQILFAVQTVNHRARAQEQQALEERVRHQMPDAGRKRAHADAQEHVAELRHGGVGVHFLDVHLRHTDGRREERRRQADHRHGVHGDGRLQ